MGDRPLDVPAEEFRRAAHRAADWVADYLEGVGDRRVLSNVAPGEIRSRMPAAPPEDGAPLESLFEDVDRVVMPGITHWNHPRFFAYFAITGSGPGIVGEFLTAALNVNGMLWRTSPAATEVEQATLDWLRQMLGLPEGFAGIIMDSASMSTLVALAAARERVVPGVRERGLAGRDDVPPLRVYASQEAHSSVDKAAITLGLGHGSVRRVDTDPEYRLDPDALDAAIRDDVQAGRRPLAVVATVGTTSTTSVDPVGDVARVCAAHDGVWLHVDGAYGGIAALVPEHRGLLDGADAADSIVVNPHKWLFTPIDCSAFFVRDPRQLTRTFSLVPEYLRSADDDVDNLMDWGVQLGRRFRALKLWMVIRHFGHAGLAARIREHIRMAADVAAWVDGHPDFERLAPTPLSTVCFRAVFDAADGDTTDRRNERLLRAVNATGKAYLSHTRLRGRYALRLAIGNLRTTDGDINETLALLEREAAALR